MLPCPEYPPEKSLGGWFWYDMQNSRYKCPNGFMFANGNYPYWYSNCTMAKIWDPPTVEECIRKAKTIKIKPNTKGAYRPANKRKLFLSVKIWHYSLKTSAMLMFLL